MTDNPWRLFFSCWWGLVAHDGRHCSGLA